MARTKSNGSKDSSAHLGFEATARHGSANPKGEAIPRSLEGNLWLAADKLRNNMDAAEYTRAERDRLPKAGRAQRGNFVESHGGQLGDISIYGQDKRARRQRPFGLAPRARRVRLRRQQPKQSNPTMRRLAIMNLALRGMEADFGPENADTFRRDLHPDLRAA